MKSGPSQASNKHQELIKRYLQYKLANEYVEGMADSLDPAQREHLNLAFDYFYNLCGETLDVNAISSTNPQTQKMYEQDAKYIFQLVERSVQSSGKGKDYTIHGFDMKKANYEWTMMKSRMDWRTLRDIHGTDTNLTISQKFLRGTLHNKEWLNDLDIQLLLSNCGLNDRVIVTSINNMSDKGSNLGTILHFRRQAQQDLVSQDDDIPLILNVGNSGDITGQGAHWVAALIHVDEANKKISIIYKDSLSISELDKQKIKDYLKKALQYKQTVPSTTGIGKLYQAYPDYTLDEHDIVIEPAKDQQDGWSCAYRALHNLIDLPNFPHQPDDLNNALLNELHTLPRSNVTSESLRDICYKNILDNVNVPDELAIKFNRRAAVNNGKINQQFLADYLDHVAQLPSPSTHETLTPEKLQELRKIQGISEKYYRDLENRYQQNMTAKTSFIIDCNELFLAPATGDHETIFKGRIKALAKFISEYPKEVRDIEIINTVNIPANVKDYLIAQFNHIANIHHFNRCDIVVMVMTTEPTFDTDIAANAAFIRYGNNLYYKNQSRHEFIKIPIDIPNLIQFDAVAKISRLMTENEILASIKSSTISTTNLPCIATNIEPTADNMDLFTIQGEEAYVFSNKNIYQIHKGKKTCNLVDSNKNKEISYSEILEAEYLYGVSKHATLDAPTLQTLETLSNHTHQKNNDRALNKELDILAARNRFIETIHMLHNPDVEDPWQEIWQKRFANGALCKDVIHLYGTLSLATTCSTRELLESFTLVVNEQVYLMADKYLSSLLEFLNNKRSYFEEQGEKFPYKQLSLGYAERYKASTGFVNLAELNDKYLIELARALEKNTYFPFTEIAIYFHDFNQSNFDNLLKVLAQLPNYPHVKTIDITLLRGGNPETLTDHQFNQLTELYQQRGIQLILNIKQNKFFDLGLASNRSEAELKKLKEYGNRYFELQNISVRARREDNIKHLPGNTSPPTSVATQPRPAVHQESKVSEIDITAIRPYKLSSLEARNNLSIEVNAEEQIEAQYQQQADLQQEIHAEHNIEGQEDNDIVQYQYDPAEHLISRDEYINAAGTYRSILDGLIPQCPNLIDQVNALQPTSLGEWFWRQILGDHNLSHNIAFITEAAASKLHAFPQYFMLGINMDNLPNGFALCESKNGLVLCYDETKFVENKNASPLTINQLKISMPNDLRWEGDLRGFSNDPLSMPEIEYQALITYNGTIYSDPTAMLYQPDREKLYQVMCHTNDKATADRILNEKLSWILPANVEPNLQNSPGYNYSDFNTRSRIYFLMDIVHRSGCEGLEVFLNAIQTLHDASPPELYPQYVKLFIDRDAYNMISSESLASAESIKCMHALAALPNDQKQWWMTLVEQHKQFNLQIDLVELFQGFQHFISKLPKDCILPIPCTITNCKEMLTGLDRLLRILSKVNVTNLQDQLSNLNFSDLFRLDQNGPWYAARWEDFHYFHPEMGLHPDAINVAFESKYLGRDTRTYRVTLEDLVKLSQADLENPPLVNQDLNYAITLFHRFLGGANIIHPQYQNYVEMTRSLLLAGPEALSPVMKIKVLPLLAVATTDVRGAINFDVTAFTAYLSTHSDVKMHQIMDAINERLVGLTTKPTLSELSSLIRMMHESNQQPRVVLDTLLPDINAQTWQALDSWRTNTARIPADHFIELHQALLTLDKKNIASFDKIIASLQGDVPPAQQNAIVTALRNLMTRPNYKIALSVLRSIDLMQTPATDLPNAVELIAVLNYLVATNNSRQVQPLVQTSFPACVFNVAESTQENTMELSANAQALIDKYNDFFLIIGETPPDPGTLAALNAAEQLQDKLHDIEPAIINKISVPSIIPNNMVDAAKNEAWQLARNNKAYKHIMSGLTEILKVTITIACEKHPILKALANCQELFLPEPVASKQYDNIGNDYVAMRDHIESMKQILLPASTILDKWENININSLINSSRTRQFSRDQVAALLNAITRLETDYAPNEIINAIFAPTALQDGLLIDADLLTKQLCVIMSIKELTISQRSKLIKTITDADSLQATDAIGNFIKFKNDYPKWTEQGFKILNTSYEYLAQHAETKSPTEIMESLHRLMNLCGHDERLEGTLINRLAHYGNPDYITFLDQKLRTSQDAAAIIKMITHSCFTRDEDARHEVMGSVSRVLAIFGGQGVVARLTDYAVLHPQEFQTLMSLYEHKPYPTIDRLNEFLLLRRPEDINQFLSEFEFDPLGKLRDRRKFAEYFDLSKAATRIDQITDLNRDNQPLFHTQRQRLQEDITYINSVGVGNRYDALTSAEFIANPTKADADMPFKLAVPGDIPNKEQYQKPVRKLTKEQIQQLIQHYRGLLSSDTTPSDIKRVAQLEFAALACAAMARTLGKFPFSTQLTSLLNVMMHGGNIFSQIRTGEGKGLITALMAAFKYAEGHKVDVCTSNKELAMRDLAEYADFYEYLGIKTGLVTAKTTAKEYLASDIHYADVSDMALFQGKTALLLKEWPGKISGIFDECEYIALDLITQFRFAANLDPKANPFINRDEWVYAHILAFVEQPEFINSIVSRKTDIENLKKYITSLDSSIIEPKYRSLFLKYSDAQLDKWIDSAYTASKLVDTEDFVIRDITINIKGQSVQTKVARVKMNDRENAESSFSDGVHQFLHARLRREAKQGLSIADFPIYPEKTYLASKSAKNFIDFYLKRGNILGLTGTLDSSKAEMKELKKNYGIKLFKIPPHKPLLRVDHPNTIAPPARLGWFDSIKFSVVPSHTEMKKHDSYYLTHDDNAKSPSNRWQLNYINKQGQAEIIPINRVNGLENHLKQFTIDNPPSKKDIKTMNNLVRKHVKAELGHFKRILQSVKKHHKEGQPYLLFCDGVYSSDKLYRYIAHELKLNENNIQLYNGEQKVTEASVIKKAGLNGMITISTSRLGRGADITPKHERGLYELDTFISPPRDTGQKKGRPARQGMRGDAELIISSAEIERHKMKMPKLTDQKAINKVISTIQEKMTHENAKQRYGRLAFADVKEQFFEFRNALMREIKDAVLHDDMFMDGFHPKPTWKSIQHESFISWEKFLKNIDSFWDNKMASIQSGMIQKPDKNYNELVDIAINELVIHANKAWKTNADYIVETARDKLITDFNHFKLTSTKPASIQIDDYAEKQIKFMTQTVEGSLKPAKPITEVVLDISMRPLAKLANENTVYLKLSQDPDPSRINDALQSELNAIGKQLYPKDAYEKFSHYQPAYKVKQLLTTLLEDRHISFQDDLAIRSVMTNLHIKLARAINQYGGDACKDSAYSTYQEHLKSHADEGIYVNDLMTTMTAMRQTGMLKPDVDLSFMKMAHNNLEDEAWEQTHALALSLLNEYAHQSGIAKDRVKAAADLRQSITDLYANHELPASEKIADLINIVNNQLKKVMEEDYRADAKVVKFSLFSYRNVNQSRYAFMLENIHDKAMSYIISDNNLVTHHHSDISVILSMLHILQDRANKLPKLQGNLVINDIAKDNHLAGLINSMNDNTSDPDNIILCKHNLLLIKDRLDLYRDLMQRTKFSSKSIEAFHSQLTTVHTKLTKFIHAEMTIESRNKDPNNHYDAYSGKEDPWDKVNDFYTSNEAQLRAFVQQSVYELLHNNADHPVSVRQFKNILEVPNISDISKEQRASIEQLTKLACHSLYEIERHCKSLYKDNQKVEIVAPKLHINDLNSTKSTFSQNHLTADVKVVTKEGKEILLSLDVNSFTTDKHQSEFIDVNWPVNNNKKITINRAPLLNNEPTSTR